MGRKREKASLLWKLWDVLYPTAAIVLCMLIATILGILAAGILTGNPGMDSGELLRKVRGLPLWINVGFYTLILLSQRKQYALDRLRFQTENRGWKRGRLAASCVLAVSLGHLISSGIRISGFSEVFKGYTEQASTAFHGQNLILLILATVILAPLAEELIFRGMTYRRAENYLGALGGALISAGLFGVYHGNMVQFLYAFFMGLLFAALCEKSGSLLPPVLAHGAANLWAVFYIPVTEALSERFSGAPACMAVLEAAAAVLCVWILFLKKERKKESRHG